MAPTTPISFAIDSDAVITATFMSGDPLRPVAAAGEDQAVLAGRTVTLDAAASYDPNPGRELWYQWQQIDGPPVAFTATLSRTTFTAPSSGTLSFSLVVTNTYGLVDSDGVDITVMPYGLFLPLVTRR